MERLVRGDVVVVPFPFSDLSDSKRRPALVVAPLQGADVILCQITSQALRDSYSIPLREENFEFGGLRQDSHIRPNRLFTAHQELILYRAGRVDDVISQQVVDGVIGIQKGRNRKWEE